MLTVIYTFAVMYTLAPAVIFALDVEPTGGSPETAVDAALTGTWSATVICRLLV